MVSGEWLIFYC